MSKINHSLERLETDYVDLYIIHREEGREMIPFCRDEKIAITPYSPLASGRLTPDEMIYLEELYVPHPVVGFIPYPEFNK